MRQTAVSVVSAQECTESDVCKRLRMSRGVGWVSHGWMSKCICAAQYSCKMHLQVAESVASIQEGVGLSHTTNTITFVVTVFVVTKTSPRLAPSFDPLPTWLH
jgi:hypothetical protein